MRPHRPSRLTRLASALLLATPACGAAADSFNFIRIGDLDSFGYGTGPSIAAWNAAGAGAADANGDGILRGGDFLPDRNNNGTLRAGGGDDFNLRSAPEVAGQYVQGVGFTINPGLTGSQFTDISLSTSYDNTFPNNLTNADPLDDFPAPPPDSAPNQPGFVFDFFVASSDIAPGALFFNLIFGDYDVSPANVKFTRLDSTTFTKGLTLQSSTRDGLIQELSTDLLFSDVFTPTAGGYRGYLKVDFVANSEPYTAFDLVEISLKDSIEAVPLPSAAGAGALLLTPLTLRRRRKPLD